MTGWLGRKGRLYQVSASAPLGRAAGQGPPRAYAGCGLAVARAFRLMRSGGLLEGSSRAICASPRCRLCGGAVLRSAPLRCGQIAAPRLPSTHHAGSSHRLKRLRANKTKTGSLDRHALRASRIGRQPVRELVTSLRQSSGAPAKHGSDGSSAVNSSRGLARKRSASSSRSPPTACA